jgi:hypothetical protein
MKAQERYFKITELLKEFENGEELYRKSPLFHQALQMMADGLSPYKAMEQIILSHERMQAAMEDMLMRGTFPLIK